jgi:hypothetical protein
MPPLAGHASGVRGAVEFARSVRRITAERLALSKAVVLEATKSWRLATPEQAEFDPFQAPLKAATSLAGGNNFDQTLDALMASIIAADTSLPALALGLAAATQSNAPDKVWYFPSIELVWDGSSSFSNYSIAGMVGSRDSYGARFTATLCPTLSGLYDRVMRMTCKM